MFPEIVELENNDMYVVVCDFDQLYFTAVGLYRAGECKSFLRMIVDKLSEYEYSLKDEYLDIFQEIKRSVEDETEINS